MNDENSSIVLIINSIFIIFIRNTYYILSNRKKITEKKISYLIYEKKLIKIEWKLFKLSSILHI